MVLKMLNKSLFSSVKQDWETPQKFFDKLNSEFDFTLDACSSVETAKCGIYFTEQDNALSKEWRGKVFCNPPYGREIKDWIKYGYEQSCKAYNEYVVMLIPARTDTEYWHKYVMKADEIRLVYGRLTFRDRKSERLIKRIKNSLSFDFACIHEAMIKRRIKKLKPTSAPFPSAVVVFRGDGRTPKFSSYERD